MLITDKSVDLCHMGKCQFMKGSVCCKGNNEENIQPDFKSNNQGGQHMT